MPNSKNKIRGTNNKKSKKELRQAVAAVLAAPVVTPLILLSGFVPMPLMIQSARAGSTTLKVSGSFITGMSVKKQSDLKFGKMVASGGTGKISVATTGAFKNSAKGIGISGQGVGKYTYKAATTKLAFDLTFKGINKLTLIASGGGKGPKGTAKLTKLLLGKVYAPTKAARTCTAVGAATTCKEVFTGGADFAVKSGTVLMGGKIVWGAVAPIGAFTKTITIIQAF